jgi:hypothetical protein
MLHQDSFLASLPGIEEEEAPTSTTCSHVNLAPALFWCHSWGERRLLQEEFRTHILYFVFVLFCFTLFLLAIFIKNTKKLVPTIVVIFVSLLLSCFIMLSINGWFL